MLRTALVLGLAAVPAWARASECPYTHLGSATGVPALVGSTCGLGDHFDGSCAATTGGEDVAIAFRAPGLGTYTFSSEGSAVDTALLLLANDCATEQACSDDTATEPFGTLEDVPLDAGEEVVVVLDTASGCGPVQLTVQGSYCGDGVVDAAETCDDGNVTSGDGCGATCVREDTCGDGTLDSGEACDDGPANSNIVPDACRTTCVTAACGDGVADTGELCDDGNTASGDGCDAACLPERGGCPRANLGSQVGTFLFAGDTCGLGNFERASCDPPGGDGDEVSFQWVAPADGVYRFHTAGSAVDTVLSLRSTSCDGPELACDDDTQGTASFLEVALGAGEVLAVLLDSDASCGVVVLNIQGDYCGNGVADGGEECDDGNSQSGDGCADDCTLEGSCGNGALDAAEGCDDGNFVAGDGCGPTCALEASYCGDGAPDAGEACDDGSSNSNTLPDACRTTCVAAHCGDGVRDTGEACDDGNPFDNDGCSSACAVGTGSCPFYDVASDLGALFVGESCDFGNYAEGSCGGSDGEEITFLWTAPAAGTFAFDTVGSSVDTVLYARAATCSGVELACSNNAVGDQAALSGIALAAAESVVLFVDSGPACGEVQLNARQVLCGDGVLDLGEECDDSGNVPGDGCSEICTLESCGDGVPDPSEGCDQGSGNSDTAVDACRTDCRPARCGDGVQDSGEQCDDGNTGSNDGCSELCDVEFTACPFYDLGSALSLGGTPVLTLETCGFENTYVPSCAPDATGEDLALVWTAPASGTFNFHTLESSLDTVLVALDGSCGGTELGCSDDLPGTESSAVAGVTLTAGAQVVLWIDVRGECGEVSLSIEATRCGDDVVDPLSGEQCDDGGSVGGDGCDAACQWELTECGDGGPDVGETCDDGASNSDTLADACRTTCQLASCGDGVVDTGEDCDDGNHVTGDGCSALCVDESVACISADFPYPVTYVPIRGDTCEGESASIASCNVHGGSDPNEVLRYMAPGRGTFTFRANARTASPVLSLRQLDCAGPELACSGAGSTGDTILTRALSAGDTVILGVGSRGACGEYDLTIEGSYCGDGRVDPFNLEACDDGNLTDGDGCTSSCARELSTCGDGTTDPGEECDDGPDNSDVLPNACRTLCQSPSCGDWVLDDGEACDDGNRFTGDGCNDACALEPLWCPVADMGSAVGSGVLTGDTCGSGDGTRGSCGGYGGGELGFVWTAPADGLYSFDAAGSSFDAVLYLRADGCDGAQILCSHSEAGGPGFIDEVFLALGERVVVVVDGEETCGAFSVDVAGRYCGDGVPDAELGEACDDGDADDTAGCANDCSTLRYCGDGIPAPGEVCDNGAANSDLVPDACRTNCTEASCGDGVQDADEACDHGGANSDVLPNRCRTSCLVAHCGDGVTDTGESCDDGNSVDTDACRNDCTLTPGVCGDDVIDFGEACDDGASNSDAVADACRTTCELPRCGDDVTDSGEQCDQGASNSDTLADRCRTLCRTPRCGDGVVDSGEQCDDGNTQSFDGCDRVCAIEPAPGCGNGVTDVGETCDAGSGNSNTLPNACRTNCQRARCGDGVKDNGEACDAGASNNNFVPNQCRKSCALPGCGDGVQDVGEACDDGNLAAGDGCDPVCALEVTVFCGNGVREAGEACDDGNTDAGDGCSPACLIEGVVGDEDGDGVDDLVDNCPGLANPSQADLDVDGLGDPCDTDRDGDSASNAREVELGTNPDHPDTDGDTVADGWDNCPLVDNADQANLDRDAAGDACDLDRDRDDVPDAQDNCPNRYNPAQSDADEDGVGDYCDDTFEPGCNATGGGSGALVWVLSAVLWWARRRKVVRGAT